MPHNAAMFAAYHPEGERALSEMATFTKELLASTVQRSPKI
jgi:hypothetical protein